MNKKSFIKFKTRSANTNGKFIKRLSKTFLGPVRFVYLSEHLKILTGKHSYILFTVIKQFVRSLCNHARSIEKASS